jgi:hypothetical protein
MESKEAFMAIPLAAICSDSRFDRQEARVLQDQLRHRAPYRDMDPLALAEMIDGLLQRFNKNRWEDLIADAGSALTQTQQETAFALATQLVYSDHIVDREEARFLRQLAQQLNVPLDRTAVILEVFALLSRDAL